MDSSINQSRVTSPAHVFLVWIKFWSLSFQKKGSVFLPSSLSRLFMLFEMQGVCLLSSKRRIQINQTKVRAKNKILVSFFTSTNKHSLSQLLLKNFFKKMNNYYDYY